MSRFAIVSGIALFCLCGSEAPAFQAKTKGPRKFVASNENLQNPERGLVGFVDLVNAKGFDFLSRNGMTLGYAGVSLAAYRNGPLEVSFLDRLGKGFEAARAAGVKVVLRFTYSENLGDSDAPKNVILRHIEQLKPVLQANGDVVAVLQAGFIGAWGEWHGSTHGLDHPTHRRDILAALLGALPPTRMVQVRAPHFKSAVAGSRLTLDRIGHHNDAFFSNENDLGTYADPVETWKEWVSQDGKHVAVGAETTGGPPRGSGAEFVAELSRLRVSFLHLRYGKDVLERWESEGHMDTIRRRLGYRLSLTDAAWPAAVRPGGELKLTVILKNTGFAAPYNRRPVYVVLTQGKTRYAALLKTADPRRWSAGEKEHKLSARLSIPSKAPSGPYRLSLWLPDETPSLREKPECAVRFANEGVWDPKLGINVLTESFRIDPQAPGPGGPRTESFAEIP